MLFLLPLILLLSGCSTADDLTIFEPVEIDSTLVNPGRGFATTGNTYNENLSDRRHPQSGVVQQRWYWDDLEPEEGNIRFSMIDSVLEKCARNSQQLNMRVMCQNVKMRIPKWAMNQGIKPPYYDNPVFLTKQENLIKALADRYDGNPDMAFVDIGTIGQWGEWHTSAPGIEMPSEKNLRKVVDIYFNHFKKTSLVMLIGASRVSGLEYAIGKGAGWRADCWGDMGDKWNHMKGFYPEALESSSAYDAWENAPIALETCWTMQEWYDQGWDIDYILSKALEWHTTEVNNGSESIPEAWWAKVKEFEKKLGYRFVLNQLEYSSTAAAGDTMDYTMTWENQGVAPIYQDYPLTFHLVSVDNTSKSRNIETDEDITQWIPGQTTSTSKIEIPADIAPGKYNLYIGLIHPRTKEPAIKLAIESRTDEGWYPMGKIQIK